MGENKSALNKLINFSNIIQNTIKFKKWSYDISNVLNNMWYFFDRLDEKGNVKINKIIDEIQNPQNLDTNILNDVKKETENFKEETEKLNKINNQIPPEKYNNYGIDEQEGKKSLASWDVDAYTKALETTLSKQQKELYNQFKKWKKKYIKALAKGQEKERKKMIEEMQKNLTEMQDFFLSEDYQKQLIALKTKVLDEETKEKINKKIEDYNNKEKEQLNEMKKEWNLNNKFKDKLNVKEKNLSIKKNKRRQKEFNDLETVEKSLKQLQNLKEKKKLDDKDKKNIEILYKTIKENAPDEMDFLNYIEQFDLSNLKKALEKTKEYKNYSFEEYYRNNKQIKGTAENIKNKKEKENQAKNRKINNNKIIQNRLDNLIKKNKKAKAKTTDPEDRKKIKERINNLNKQKKEIKTQNSKLQEDINHNNDIIKKSKDLKKDAEKNLSLKSKSYKEYLDLKIKDLEKKYNLSKDPEEKKDILEKIKKLKKTKRKIEWISKSDNIRNKAKNSIDAIKSKISSDFKKSNRIVENKDNKEFYPVKWKRDEIEQKELGKINKIINWIKKKVKEYNNESNEWKKERIKEDMESLTEILEKTWLKDEIIEQIKSDLRKEKIDQTSNLDMVDSSIKNHLNSKTTKKAQKKFNKEWRNWLEIFVHHLLSIISTFFENKRIIFTVFAFSLTLIFSGFPFIDTGSSIILFFIFILNSFLNLLFFVFNKLPLIFSNALWNSSLPFVIFSNINWLWYRLFLIVLFLFNLGFYFIFWSTLFGFLLFRDEKEDYTIRQKVLGFFKWEYGINKIINSIIDFLTKNYFLFVSWLFILIFILFNIESKSTFQLSFIEKDQNIPENNQEEIKKEINNNVSFNNIYDLDKKRYERLTDKNIIINNNFTKSKKNILPGNSFNYDSIWNILALSYILKKDYLSFLERKTGDKITDSILWQELRFDSHNDNAWNLAKKDVRWLELLNDSSKEKIKDTIDPFYILLTNDLLNGLEINNIKQLEERANRKQDDLLNINNVKENSITQNNKEIIKQHSISLIIFLDSKEELKKVINWEIDTDNQDNLIKELWDLNTFYVNHYYTFIYNWIHNLTYPLLAQNVLFKTYLNDYLEPSLNASLSLEDETKRIESISNLISQDNIINHNTYSSIIDEAGMIFRVLGLFVNYMLILFFALDKRFVYLVLTIFNLQWDGFSEEKNEENDFVA